MKISILSPNISSNSLGRAWMLGKILKHRYDVEIVGPSYGKGLWKPFEGEDLIYKVVDSSSAGCLMKSMRRMVTGDVMYASKPLFSSFGLGLMKRRADGIPLVLDIDDWELGFSRNRIRLGKLVKTVKYLTKSVLHPLSNSSAVNIALLEALTRMADQITVSGSFLQKRFGGIIVWHARDTDFLNPEKYDGRGLRESYGLSRDKRVVMFLGTVRKHKGVEDVLTALAMLKNPSVIFVLVGVNEGTYKEKLQGLCDSKLGRQYRFFGMQPLGKVPDFLAMADVVVIPQRRNPATIGQVPAKVFDAMAMAKPVIATNVSDLPEVLNGCGWIVEPENPEPMARAVQHILDNPVEAEEKGSKARQKCIEKYSWTATKAVLTRIFEKYS